MSEKIFNCGNIWSGKTKFPGPRKQTEQLLYSNSEARLTLWWEEEAEAVGF